MYFSIRKLFCMGIAVLFLTVLSVSANADTEYTTITKDNEVSNVNDVEVGASASVTKTTIWTLKKIDRTIARWEGKLDKFSAEAKRLENNINELTKKRVEIESLAKTITLAELTEEEKRISEDN